MTAVHGLARYEFQEYCVMIAGTRSTIHSTDDQKDDQGAGSTSTENNYIRALQETLAAATKAYHTSVCSCLSNLTQ